MTLEEVVRELCMEGGCYLKTKQNEKALWDDREVITMGRIKGPECLCNYNPPQLMVYCYKDVGPSVPEHRGSVSFCVVGETPSGWVDLRLYAIDRDKAVDYVDEAERLLSLMWSAAFLGSGS